MTTQLTVSSLLDERKNYVLTHTPDRDRSWRMNCAKSILEEHARNGDFFLVLRCDFGIRNEKIFAIPYSYLQQVILPKAFLYPDGRYTFNIRKRDFRFTWMHKIYMDGTQFLRQSFQLWGATIFAADLEEEIHRDLEKSPLISTEDRELQEINSIQPSIQPISIDQTFEERLRYRLHRTIDRNQKLSAAVKQIHGYICQVCGFNFEREYGKLGQCYIEAHHLVPLAQLPPTEPHRLSPTNDFAVLCANCHRMIHRREAPASFIDFVNLYKQGH